MKPESYINGWFAHKGERSQEENPYKEKVQDYSHNQWISGWCDRFSAVKHGLNLSLDEMDIFS